MEFPRGLCMKLLDGKFAMCRLPPGSSIPDWAWKGRPASVTSTVEELSILCPEKEVPQGVNCQVGWRVLEVQGPLDPFSVGIIAGLSSALAEAGIPLCVVSTCLTDYFLIREQELEKALEVIQQKGGEIQRADCTTRCPWE